MKIIRKILIICLLFSLLTSTLLPHPLPAIAQASAGPWIQSDWSGGSGQSNWSTTNKFSSSSGVTASTASQVTLTQTSGWCNNSFCNSSWLYRRKVTFDNSAQAENQTNFPVLVKLDSTRINYSNTQNSGEDIRFTDTDGTDLPYEIEKWDETGSSWVWVKVPQVDASSSTDYIYIYYGNSSATDHQQVTSVWNSNFKGVWHLPNGTTLTASDSTSNANNGTITGTTATTGQVDGAADFNGTSNHIDIGTGAGLSGAGAISFWMNFQNGGNASDRLLIVKRDGTGTNYQLSMRPTDSNKFQYYDGTTQVVSTYVVPASQWINLALVRTAANTLVLYVNGVSTYTFSQDWGAGTAAKLEFGGSIPVGGFYTKT